MRVLVVNNTEAAGASSPLMMDGMEMFNESPNYNASHIELFLAYT